PRAAARESAFAVAVADLPHHPRRRLTSHPAEADHVARLPLDHRLYARVAEQTLERPWVDYGTSLDLAATGFLAAVGARVDHDRRPVLIGVGGDPARTHRHQRVGTPGRGEEAGLFV